MPKPILLAIDDDTSVLEAVVQDLRRHYGQDYRIVRAASGAAALDICRQLQERKDTVALFLSDQRMPGMTGVDFLQQALTIYPDAKRVLLTAYADTEAAIRAINAAKIHYYLNKPWDPPEEKLYPVLDDLLETWKQGYKPPYEGIIVVGTRWSSADHNVREFLSRNRIPYKWLSPEQHPEAVDLLKERGLDDSKLPVVIFGDGTSLVQPTSNDLATKLGMPRQAQQKFYDIVIVGAGPAGLAAGVYAASEGLGTLIVEGEAIGGQAGSSSKIENYLGFPTGVSGQELAARAITQAQKFGAKMMIAHRVVELRCGRRPYEVVLDNDSVIAARTVIISTGAQYNKPPLANLKKFEGRGIYYGATFLEAQLCGNEDVIIVGGGNSAGQAAVYLSQTARKVHMLVRSSGLSDTMSRYLIQRITENPRIELHCRTEITGLDGQQELERTTWIDRDTGETSQHDICHVFIMAGASPRTDWLRGCVALDDKGFIQTGRDLEAAEGVVPSTWPLTRPPQMLETSLPGVFAVGDVRSASVKRVASAVGEGAIAISLVHRALAEL
jgi:thioredoxin reductase (NADPH)